MPPRGTLAQELNFEWVETRGSTGRYRDATTKKFVKESVVLEAMELRVSQSEERMIRIAENFAQGNLRLIDFQIQMRNEIRVAHLMSGAVAKGGWKNLTQGDFGFIGFASLNNYRRLQRWAQQISRGETSAVNLLGEAAPQFINRARLYARSVRGTFWQMKVRMAQLRGFNEERRIRFPGDSCNTCIQEAELGWQPINTLRRIGDTECGSNDRCTKEFRRREAETL